eukprot:8793407-Pyramimonas_sp.AAC.1
MRLDAPTRLKATYSWPWENTGSGKYNPTCCNPHGKLEATQDERQVRVPRRKGDLGNVCSGARLCARHTSRTRGCARTTMARTPLTRPASASKFLSNMTRAPGASASSWGGSPDGVRLFKKSVGQRSRSAGDAASTSSTL